EWIVRVTAARALGDFPEQRDVIIPQLDKSLSDQNRLVRVTAARTLLMLGASATELIPVLVEAAGAPDWLGLTRLEAIDALGHGGESAVPALIALLKSEHSSARAEAAETLGHMGPPAKAAVPALLEASRDPDSQVRAASETALALIGR